MICYNVAYHLIIIDFNIDLHNTNDHVANTHISVLHCIGLEQIISSPTRVSQTCSSLIDHIYTNMDISNIREGTIIAVCAIFDEIRITKATAPQIKFRSYKRYQLVDFHRDLANAPRDTIYESADVNDAYSKFSSLFIAICDKHAPLVNKTKGKHVHKPWLTKAIKKSIKSKHRMYSKLVKSGPNPELHTRYKKYRNMLTSVLRNAKNHIMGNFLKSIRIILLEHGIQ